ncbi:conserved domain protein [delta proteobacterium NaphS2]|nr:conserved domain protein [delta proteobacterium NaphS2]
MNHEKGENELGVYLQPQIVFLCQVGFDPLFKTHFFGPSHHPIQHFLLNVQGHHMSFVSHQFCQADGIKPQAASQIHNGHPRSDIFSEKFRGIVNQASQPMIKGIRQPPGTNKYSHIFGYPYRLLNIMIQVQLSLITFP